MNIVRRLATGSQAAPDAGRCAGGPANCGSAVEASSEICDLQKAQACSRNSIQEADLPAKQAGAGGSSTGSGGGGATGAGGGVSGSMVSVLDALAGASLADSISRSTSSRTDETEAACQTWLDNASEEAGGTGSPALAGRASAAAAAAPARIDSGSGAGSSSAGIESAGNSVGSSSSSSACWQPSRAQVQASATPPLLVAAHHGLPYQRILSTDCNPQQLPVNNGRPVEFETPLFSGRACIYVRGLPGAPDAVFGGRRRRTLITVQGRFKQPVPLDDLVTGQEFGRVENLPAAWLVEGVLLKVARTVSPSMTIGPLSAPSMLMPVAAGCSEICASRPGQEPHPAEAPREDMRLFDASLASSDGSPLPAARRKSFFSRAANRAGRCFDTELVWTFYFYQHVVDASTYELDVLYKFDLCKYLAGQPLQLMMRTLSTGQYLYCFHMWHDRLLKT